MEAFDLSTFYRQEEDRSHSRIMMWYISRALWPFNVGLVTFRIEDQSWPGRGGRKLVIQCSLLVDDICVLDAEPLMAIDTAESMAHWAGKEAGKFFRSCMDEPAPSNIILGEE